MHNKMPHKNMSSGDKNSQPSPSSPKPSPYQSMPDWLPQKFWDSNSGEVRLKELVKSYRALEKRLSSFSNKESSDKSSSDEVAESNSAPNNSKGNSNGDNPVDNPVEKLRQEAAQIVDIGELENSEDYSQEKFDKLVSDDDLVAEFGSLERWQRVRPQLAVWAKRNLGEGVHDALSTSIDGIRHMHNLMLQASSAKEPQLVQGGDMPQALSEDRLRRMMQDPRYWRDRDPEFINRVMAGFRQLYDN